MLDRTQQPISPALSFSLPSYKQILLGHQIPCYIIEGGDQEIIKLEICFPAGEKEAEYNLLAVACNRMLEEGTSSRNSQQIAEELDSYGAYLSLQVEKDYASVSLYALTPYFSDIMPVFQDLLTNPRFDPKELATYLNNTKQHFLVNLEKVSVLSKRKFMAHVFGENHPYGRSVNIEDYGQVDSSALFNFFHHHYSLQNATVFVSGRVSQDKLDLISKMFEKIENTLPAQKNTYSLPKQEKGHFFTPKSEAIQSAIRVGGLALSRNNSDYPAWQLLNTILGGYFGSRLMMNIREDKGYTYGISSHAYSFKEQGFFMISTEVGSEFTQDTLTQIKIEMDKLSQELISEQEISKVRNYMIGSLLRQFDGPLEVSDRLKTTVMLGLDFSYYEQYIQSLYQADAAKLNKLAQQYLRHQDMIELVVGAK